MTQSEIGRSLSQDGPGSIAEAMKIAKDRNDGIPYDAEKDWKSLEAASSTSLYAAFEPSLKGRLFIFYDIYVIGINTDLFYCNSDSSGIFLRNCAPYEVRDYAKNSQDAEKLWKLSEGLVHQKFEL